MFALLAHTLFDDPEEEGGADRRQALAQAVVQHVPSWEAGRGSQDPVAWVFATIALRRTGPYVGWGEWLAKATQPIAAHQCDEGEAVGSWNPSELPGYAGGRTRLTALIAWMAGCWPPPCILRTDD